MAAALQSWAIAQEGRGQAGGEKGVCAHVWCYVPGSGNAPGRRLFLKSLLESLWTSVF